jgi:hypothetical protein
MADIYEEYDQINTDGSLKDDKVGSELSQITILSKKDEIPILNLQCKKASNCNGNGKYNTNKQTNDHSQSSLLAASVNR